MNYQNKYLKYIEKNKQLGGSLQNDLYFALLACNNPATCNEARIEELSQQNADILSPRFPGSNIVLYDVMQELHNRGRPLIPEMYDALAIPLSGYLRPENRDIEVQRINQRSEYSIPIVSVAVAMNEDELLRGLIRSGADIHATYAPMHDSPPLMQAIYQNKENMCRILIDAGANINYQNKDGQTIQMRMAIDGNIPALKLLRKLRGLDNTIRNNRGETVFAIVARLAASNPAYNQLLPLL